MNLPINPKAASNLTPAYKKIAASLVSVSSEDTDLMFDLFGKLIDRHINTNDCDCGNNTTHEILDEIQLMIALELGAAESNR